MLLFANYLILTRKIDSVHPLEGHSLEELENEYKSLGKRLELMDDLDIESLSSELGQGNL